MKVNTNKVIITEVFTELREQLYDKYSDTCPAIIAKELLPFYVRYAWNITGLYKSNFNWCALCQEHFHFIKGNYNICPCRRESNPEEIMLRLEEVIEEYSND